MTKHRVLLWMLITVVLAAVVIPAQAAPAPKEPAPKVGGPKAGSISALLPVARIVRGSGKNLVTSDAKKGDDLTWNDLVKTEKGGRARITLVDQSILSLGSQAELRIVKHDSRSQQTALALGYGRLRAEVTKIARQGGSFELKTPTAVAGVIGTDFGTDASSVGTTTFLCISGQVQVANVDPNVGGAVQCMPGMTTSVAAGKPPTIPTSATQQQIQQLMEDTEPALIAAMSPTSSLPNATVDATITGTKMAGIKSVSITGAGITASLAGTPTDTSVTVHLVIDASAAAGPRTITLSKQSGAASAAVFSILTSPTAQQATNGDPKKPYHDTFEQERQSARAGLAAYVIGAQQSADLAVQQLQTANQGAGVDLTKATASFNAQVAAVQKAVDDAGTQIDAAKAAADTAFDAQYQTAYNAFLQSNDEKAFNDAVQALFNQINANLGSNFNGIRGSLSGTAQTASGNIAQVQADWTSTINTTIQTKQAPPTPKVNSPERSVDLGAALGENGVAALDASSSTGANGASIVSYNWGLCPANNPTCTPIYTATTSEFGFPTCTLAAGDYNARVTVKDSNNQSAFLDVKVHVLAPTYDDPGTRFNNLAAAYQNLNVNGFLDFFDQMKFPGFTVLSENVRKNFPLLATMTVLPQISTSSISCNDATLSGTWDEKLTYASAPKIIIPQKETLTTVHMVRTPGTGWKITDFQGSNGSIPGAPNVDSSAPDLAISAIYPSYAGGPASTAIPVPPGNQPFTAVIVNKGTADYSAGTVVRFTLQDATGATLSGPVDMPLPVPLAANASVSVSTSQLTIPASIGMAFLVQVNVNPGQVGTPAEPDYSNNVATTPMGAASLFVGTPVKLGLLSSSPLAFITGGAAQTLQVSVSDASDVTLALPAGFTLGPANATCANTSATMKFTGAGTACWNLLATFSAPAGTGTTSVTAVASGISVPLGVPYTVVGPIMTASTAPSLTTNDTTVQPLTVNVTLPGSYTLSFPAGVTTSSPNPAVVTSAPANISWDLSANFAAVAGTFTSANSTLKISPGGVYTTALAYSVAGPKWGQSTPPSLIVGEGSLPMSVTVNVPGQYQLALPTGIILDPAYATSNPNPQSPLNGTLTWYVKADLTSGLALGNNQSTTVTALLPAGGPSQYTYGVMYSANKPNVAQVLPGPALPVGGTAPTQLQFTVTNAPNSWFMLSYPINGPFTVSSPVFQQPLNGTLKWQIDATTAINTLSPPSIWVVQLTDSPTNNGSPSQYRWPPTGSAAYTVAGPTWGQTPTTFSTYGGDPTARLLQVTVNAGGTYALVTPLPTGINATLVSPANGILPAGGGTLQWSLTADASAAAGPFSGGASGNSPLVVSSGQQSYKVAYQVLAPDVVLTPSTLPPLVAGGSQLTITATSQHSHGPFTLVLPPGAGFQINSGLNPQTAPQTSPPYSVQWIISAAPTATVPGSGNITVTAGNFGTVATVPYTVEALGFTPALQTIQLTAGYPGPIAPLSGNINDVGAYSLVTPLPTGITAAGTSPQQVTVAPGLLTWDLQADFGAAQGAGNVVVTNGLGGNVNVGYVVNKPNVQSAGTWQVLVAGGPPQTIQFTTPVPGTYRLGVGGTGTNILTGDQIITAANGGTLSWDLQAIATAATGPQTVIVVALTPSGGPSSYIWDRNPLATTPWTYVVNAPGAPTLTPTVLALTSGAGYTTLTADFTSAGSFTLQAAPTKAWPTGIILDPTTPATQQITNVNGGRLVWNLKADYTAVPNPSPYTDVVISDGIHTPWVVPYTVAGAASYVITNVVIPGHTPGAGWSYLGAQGFQIGETISENVTITNQGNADGTGQIVVMASCTGPSTACSGQGPSSPPVAAPAKNGQVTANVPITFQQGMPTGSYQGKLALTDGTNPVPLAGSSIACLLNPTPACNYEVVDFTFASGQPFTGAQNLVVGTTGTINATLSEQGTTTTFPIGVTITPGITGVTYSGPTSVTPASPASPAPVTFSLDGTSAPASGIQTVTLTATNHGVSKWVTQDVNLMSASFSTDTTGTPLSRNIFLNNAGNPLVIQVGQAVGVMLPAVNMKMTATPSVAGDMLLVPATNNDSHFTSTITVESGFGLSTGPTVTGSSASFLWQITANGPTTTVVGLQVEGRLLNSSPQIIPSPITYTLYVQAVATPNLQVVSVTPAGGRTIDSTHPWLAGETISFDVVVKNAAGAGTSTGGEKVSMKLGTYHLGNATVPSSLTGGSTSAPITITATAPDFGGTSGLELKTKIQTCQGTPGVVAGICEPGGDMNYDDNTYTGITLTGGGNQTVVPLADWGISLAGTGSTDASALQIPPPAPPQPVPTLQFAVVGGGTAVVPVTLNPGAVSTGIVLPTFGPSFLTSTTLNPPTSSIQVNVSTNPTAPPAGGYAYAQVIAQIGSVQRQATIHVVIGAAPGSQPISITNGVNSPVLTNAATPLQLNGPLVERFTVIPSCGTGCSGTVDLTFNDAASTVTTPTQIPQAAMGVEQTVTIIAAMDPDGEVIGPMGLADRYGISATGAAIAGRRGGVSPSPVGPPIPLYVKVGDIELTPGQNMTASACIKVAPGNGAGLPQGPYPTAITATWTASGGFNKTVSWQIVPATGPVTFEVASGTATPPSYTEAIATTLKADTAYEGLYQYAVAVTISNGISSATKYFPFYVDASSAQNYCSATSSARGSTGRLKGTWNRSGITLGPVSGSAALRTSPTTGALPDLHISASDVSYTPSIPKVGDAVQVRFRVSNQGNGDAVGVPIAFQINGATVAVDTFNVPAGKTALAGLQWNGVLPPGVAPRLINVAERAPVRGARGVIDPDAALARRTPSTGPAVALRVLSAAVVIDPQHTIQQKSTLEKSAPLAHFSLRNPDAAAAAADAVAGSQRVLLELGDGACVGLRLTTGSAGPCGSADAELNVDDKGGLSLNTLTGVADLGGSFGPATSSARLDPARLSSARYALQTAVLAGHSYAVQLSAGRTALVTVVSVRNPGELDAKARALFRASALRVLGKLGGDTAGPTGPGDVAGGSISSHTVFVELAVQSQ